MTFFGGSGIYAGAAIATVVQEVAIHPVDTVITRVQSPAYAAQYKHTSGSLRRGLFLGLYQGFGPTLLAGVPASIAFFSVYEGSKHSLGQFSSLPSPLVHAVSSAAAEVVACAVINPAEVIKQNAQVWRNDASSTVRQRPVFDALRQLSRHPSRLWTGYSMLLASSLPGTSLMFCLYEWLKAEMSRDNRGRAHDVLHQLKITAASAGLAGGITSCLFVPVDVVKTHMRLAPVETAGRQNAKAARPGALMTARQILGAEGIQGLFRGLKLTFVASAFGAGLYMGCYEACKLYIDGAQDEIDERSSSGGGAGGSDSGGGEAIAAATASEYRLK